MSKESKEVRGGFQRQTWSLRARRHLQPACQRCEATHSRGKRESLTVHHIDEDWTNNSPENLETLCQGCHNTHHFKGKGAGCSVEGCTKPHSAKGMCRNHYVAAWRKRDMAVNPERYVAYGRKYRKARQMRALAVTSAVRI